MIRMCNPL